MSADDKDDKLLQERAQDDDQGSARPVQQSEKDKPAGGAVKPYSDGHMPTPEALLSDGEASGGTVKPLSDGHMPAPPAALRDGQPSGGTVKPYSDGHMPAPEALLSDGEPVKPKDEFVSGEGA